MTDSSEFNGEEPFFKWESFDLSGLLTECEQSISKIVYLYHADLNFLWKEFIKQFVLIEAAGGVVENNKNEILFIFRNEKWDLPKGKVDKGETVPEAALREVSEECGITNLNLKGFITSTYHIYVENGQQILKVTHWYKMNSTETELKPQSDEGITRVVWKGKKEIESAMKNTYPNIKLLIDSI